MSKEIVHTDKAPKSLAGYSQVVKAGGFVFVAGLVPSIRLQEKYTASRSIER